MIGLCLGLRVIGVRRGCIRKSTDPRLRGEGKNITNNAFPAKAGICQIKISSQFELDSLINFSFHSRFHFFMVRSLARASLTS